MINTEHHRLMDRLQGLRSCALVTTGRAGSDFFQGLFDSHPEVLTFNGNLFYYEFWENSKCVRAGDFDARDLIDEFIGKYIERFKSRYDLQERKHQLGENLDETISIDLDRFRNEAVGLLEERSLDSKNAMLAIYGAYAICLGQDLETKTLLFHHPHHFEELPQFLRDFPDGRLICMTRDPRANFVEGIEDHRANNFLVGDTDRETHIYYYINRILHDASALEIYDNPYIAVKIEDLGDQAVVDEMCRWLGISPHECTTRSTWGGLVWHGDKLTNATTRGKWSGDVLVNLWEKRLSFLDRYMFNYLMNSRLKHYGYSHKRVTPLDALIIPFLIPLPLRYELRFASVGYVLNALRKRDVKKLAQNMFYYMKRISLFIKFYLKVTKGEKFNQPLLKLPAQGASSTTPSA